MVNKLLSIEDLYAFYSTKKRSMKFSSEKSGYNIAVQTKASFSVNEDADPAEGLMFCKIRAFHDLGNLNKSFIEKDVLEKNLCSMENRPIMADIVETRDPTGKTVKDFNGHTVQYDEKNDKLVYIEHPVGHFIKPEDFHLEYDEEYDRDFAVADAVIYEEYTDTCDILRRRGEVECSVELVIRDMAYDAKSKELHINDFYVQGCTLLGASVPAAMKGSKLTLGDFSESKNSAFYGMPEDEQFALINTLERLNNTLSSLNIENYRKEDEPIDMKKFEENTETQESEVETPENTEVEEVNTTETESQDVPKLLDDDEPNIGGSESEDTSEESTDDEVENVTENATEDSEEGSEDNSDESSETFTRSFELSHDDIRCALYVLLAPYEDLDAEWYFISDVYDDRFIYEGCFTSKIYSQAYVKDGDLVSFEGERVEMFRELLTASEKAELETMRSNYSTMQTELNTYKNKELASQREEILADEAYSEYLNTEEFTKIRENINTYSLEDLRTECELAYAKAVRSNKKLSFTTEEPKKSTPSFFGFAHAERESSFFDGLLKSAK